MKQRASSIARKAPAPDVYQIVTDRIIDLLSAGVVPWRKSWTTTGVPRNLCSGKPYRGINVWLLSCASYSSPYWLSYRQAQARGGNVRKGEKGTLVVFWKMYQRKEADQQTGQEQTKTLPVLRYYTVFNEEQCEGIDAPTVQAATHEHEPIAAEALWNAWSDRPALDHRGNAALYRRETDCITMPPRPQFETPESYYFTLFHEATHATGHAARLARPTLLEFNRFGSKTHAKEELVAEMGGAYLCGHCGIGENLMENAAAYVAHWLGKLREDKTLIVHAAANAQKAADYILRDSAPAAEEADEQEGDEA